MAMVEILMLPQIKITMGVFLMETRKTGFLAMLVVAALVLAGCGGSDGEDGKDGADGSWFAVVPVSSADRLDIKIEKVTVSSPPVVTFKVTDGNGLSVAGVTTSQVRFNIARLEKSDMGNPSYWVNYLGPGATERVAANLEELDDGRYQYTFAKDITKDPNYDASLTHRVAMQISGFPPTNPVFDFRPDGGAVTTRREIVKIESCNSCHNELALHGGGRVDTKYCVTCHNPGTIDADTGNTVDFKILIHKIHRGEELPSVNGSVTPFIPATPYQIIGYGGSVHDYSTVVFPQDIRNCTKCHEASAETPQGDNWKTRPSVEACGSCHDDIYFGAAAEPPLRMVAHPGGPTSNAFCKNCHVDGGDEKWQIDTAHRNPLKDAEGKFQYNIRKVCGTDPEVADPNCVGTPVTPTIEFSVSDPTGGIHGYGGANSNYDIANDPEFGAGASLNILTAWDSSDYTNVDGDGTRPSRANSYSLGNLKTNAVDDGTGNFTISVDPMPGTVLTGSGGVAMEGHPRGESDPGSGTYDISVPVRGEVAYFGINGDPMVERRVAVDIADKCDNCHDKLSLHGNNRADNAQLCVMCHNPRNTDISQRSGVGIDGKLEESIDMKRLIHAIHAADRDEHGFRENGIVIYGYGGSTNDFSHVRFPGILNDCTTCHNDGTYELSGKWEMPLQNGILASTISSGADAADQTDDLYTTPTAAVCSACHDGALAQEHMVYLGGAKFSADKATIDGSLETCAICHGPGKIADLNVVHEIE